MLSSMVLRDLSPRPPDFGWPLCLRHLAASYGPQRAPKTVLRCCIGHLGPDDMLGADEPILSKRVIFGQRCSSGSCVVRLREISGEWQHGNSRPDSCRLTSAIEG